MKKAIILLSGTPSGKRIFNEIAFEMAWVWNINPKNYIIDNLFKKIEEDGANVPPNETFYKNLSELMSLLNKNFDFEKKFLKNKVGRFNRDMDGEKTSEEGKSFSSALLVLHGVSQELTNHLKEEYGVFKIHIAMNGTNPKIENYDVVLWENAEDFGEKVRKTLGILLKGENI